MHYIVVDFPEDPAEFADRVSIHLKCGWVPVGGMNVVYMPEDEFGPATVVFMQAMMTTSENPAMPVFENDYEGGDEEGEEGKEEGGSNDTLH